MSPACPLVPPPTPFFDREDGIMADIQREVGAALE